MFSTDFETGLPAQILAPGALIEGVQGYAGLGATGNQFSGSFLRYSSVPLYDTKLTVRNLPAHARVSLGFLLGVIDSWDGTELFQVTVDGNLLFSHWFQLATGDTSNYFAPSGGLLSRGHNLGFSNGSYYFRDRAYDMGVDSTFIDIPHTADSVVIVWKLSAVSGPAAAQWQGGLDESWAIDNVRVSVSNVADGVSSSEDRGVFALRGARRNPVHSGGIEVGFSLPSADRATLELFDPSGRRLAFRAVGPLGAGTHSMNPASGLRLASGVYFVRLSQGGRVRVARVAVLD